MDNVKITKDAEIKLVEAMEKYKQLILSHVEMLNNDDNISLRDIEIAIQKTNQQRTCVSPIFKRNHSKELFLWFLVCICLLFISFGGILTVLGDTDRYIDLSKTGEIVMLVGSVINIILFISIFVLNFNKRQFPSKEVGVIEFMNKWNYFEEKLKLNYHHNNKGKIPSYFELIEFLIQSNGKEYPDIVVDFKSGLHFRNDLVHRTKMESVSMDRIKDACKKLDKLIKRIES